LASGNSFLVMRSLRRIKNTESSAIYHAMSRVVGGQMLLGDREKEVLRKMLWQVADFCGVEVLTYSIMTNHFHVLVRVPEKDRLVSNVELLRRFKVLYPKPTKYQTASFLRLETALRDDTEDAVKIREQLLARMHDLSEFMKTLKQRFSIWYDRNHDSRMGTLWMDRFKSVLVEGSGNPLQTMAAYIDLNPVRAGLADDPKDYPVGVVMPRRWEEASRPAGRFVSFLARRWRAGRPAGGRPIAASC
jgi:REP element-mobilizing transposase RayT